MSAFDSSSFSVDAFSTDAFDLEEVAGSIRGTASGSCTVSGTLTSEENLEVNVSWVEFNPTASVSDTRVSWVEFNPVASVTDVRVSWVQFNPVAQTQTGAGWYPDQKKKRKKYIVEGKILYATPHELAYYLGNLNVKPEEVKKAVRKPNKRALVTLEDVPVTTDPYGYQFVDMDVSGLFKQYNPIDDSMARMIARIMLEIEEDDIECLLLAA